MDGKNKESKQTKKKGRRKCLGVLAVDPNTGKSYTVFISYTRLQQIGKRSIGQIKETSEILPMILQKPTAIFEGLCTDEDEDYGRGVGWRCYCGVPSFAYLEDGSRVTPYPSEVYLAFVNEDRIVYNWRWAKCDSVQTDLPINHKTRFKKRLL